ncbi:MAG TPA: hypothetical protein VGK19_24930 [Capsulimonadaceae bacterium]|jgi:5-methylcytosine-specific restriction enzyme subunit McrC
MTHFVQMAEWSVYPGPNDSALPASVLFDGSSPETATVEKIDILSKRGLLQIEDFRNGLIIKSRSFVGKVRFGGLEITVEPKITGAPFMRLLRYAYSLRNLDLMDRATFETESLCFQDLLIYQLLLEATELANRGLRREFVRKEHLLPTPRGRFDINAIARTGVFPTDRLPCITHDRDVNVPLNRVLLAGLSHAARSTDSLWLRGKLNWLSSILREGVTPLKLSTATITDAQRCLTRITRVYEPALNLIELLYAGQGLSLDAGASVYLSGFLFDMNRFFQSLLSRFLNEHLVGFEVCDEESIRGMMRYDPANNPLNRRSPTLRPDFAIRQGGSTVAILDAKYRDLWRSDLPREMLYQLAMYALSQPTERSATILYPALGPSATDARIVITDPIDSATPARVIVRPVDLLAIDRVISQTMTPNRSAVATMLANSLVFGSAHA